MWESELSWWIWSEKKKWRIVLPKKYYSNERKWKTKENIKNNKRYFNNLKP